MKEKVLALQEKINSFVTKASDGEIPFESIYEHIQLREFLPETTVLATTWSIEDLREKFSEGTDDQDLIFALKDLSGALTLAAVISGQEVIADYVQEEPEESESDEELATCSMCGKTSHENEINMIDYDLDVCVTCEKENKIG